MRKGWVGVLGAVFLSGLAMAGESRQASLGPNLTARLEPDSEIVLIAQPSNGDSWSRLALRMTGDAAHWRELARINGQGEALQRGRRVRIPLAMARERLQLEALRALFPDDAQTSKGWRHKVVAGTALEGESLWSIAEWFTGDGANYARIREANQGQTLSTRRGDVDPHPERSARAGVPLHESGRPRSPRMIPRRSRASRRSRWRRRSRPSRTAKFSSSTRATAIAPTRSTGCGRERPSTPRSASASRGASTRKTSTRSSTRSSSSTESGTSRRCR